MKNEWDMNFWIFISQQKTSSTVFCVCGRLWHVFAQKTGIDRGIIWTRTSKQSCRSLSRGLRVKKWAQSDKKRPSYEFSREMTLKFEFTGSTPSFCEINQKRRSSEYRSNSESKERLKIAKFVILRFENGRDTIKIDRVMIFASLRIRRNASRKFFSFFNFQRSSDQNRLSRFKDGTKRASRRNLGHQNGPEMLLWEYFMNFWTLQGNCGSICKPHWKLLDYGALGDLSTSSKGTLL